MRQHVDESKWEWWATISKTHAPGGSWLFEFHGGWHGTEDNIEAFHSLTAAKKYARNDGQQWRFVKISDSQWFGYLPVEQGEDDAE